MRCERPKYQYHFKFRDLQHLSAIYVLYVQLAIAKRWTVPIQWFRRKQPDEESVSNSLENSVGFKYQSSGERR